jgi:hypothetical protein
MMSAESHRVLGGVVYIAESDLDWLAVVPDAHLFEGHWEGEAPNRLIERGPGWDSPDAAIAWGRERATKILLRIGRRVPQMHFSAGLVNPWASGAEQIPEWPPSIEDLPLIEQQLADDDGTEDDPEVAAAVAVMRRRLESLMTGSPEIVWLEDEQSRF